MYNQNSINMRKITIKSLLIIALAIIPMTFFGQNNGEEQQAKPNNNHYWTIGFDEGATLLFGDNKPWDFKNVRPEIGIFGGYTFAKHFSVYARLSAGTVRGKLDKTLTIENASFLGADINLAVDLVSLLWGYNPDRVFGLVPHIGFGQIQYQTRAYVNGNLVKYGYDDATTTLKGKGIGGRRIAWELPMGVRFDFNLNRKCALFLDIMATRTDTDRLDAYATSSSKHYDWFSAGLVGFRYNFRKNDPAAPCYTQDELNKQVEDALKKYKDENPPVSEEEIQKRIDEEVAKATAGMTADNTNNEGEVTWEAYDVNLKFAANKTEVEESDYNKSEVKKISDDKANGRDITNIRVEGWASPEGYDDQNQTLSQKRADATVKYIKKGLGEEANSIKFESKGMGSDWEGFRNAVNDSNISNKEEVLKVIDAKDTKALNVLKEKNPELKNLLKELRITNVFVNE